MELGCSHSFVPFQPVGVRCEPVNSGQPTRTGNSVTDFCGGTVQLDSRAGVPLLGQRVLLTQIISLHAIIPQGKAHTRRC